ncbi:hypothetical protein RHSIM_Rhsim03G0237000 [Rhododendron simsii]|uniref:Initiator tRNA phosphoribosyl transferase family protein n=1 Tax=Rhododendron simsii TaxID=118357 RepID=A0A834HG88_RHOSS|nr:hypothetical protein RHSIM_Rhsim03G0237000 [Rhododendron simsii]
MEDERVSIYKTSRTIKRRENSLYNALRSIYEDSIFVGEIALLWPELPLLANLRCGLWYSSQFESNCYFKSTDGHTNNWSFNTSRLNLHVALLAGQRGGCIIVDSTRKGKRFPDSMSKTIPIWICVLNRAIKNHQIRMHGAGIQVHGPESNTYCQHTEDTRQVLPDWDCSLHLPLWVSETEKIAIEDRLEVWTKELESCGADITSLASSLKKPLRPLWMSQKTVIWLNEVPECSSWDFTPIILVSASSSSGNFQHRTTSEFSWNYIPGAGDDEESWARCLSPSLFWNHVYDLIYSGPESCNQKVANIVEKDRVYRAQRGQNAPQISMKPSESSGRFNLFYVEEPKMDEEPKMECGIPCVTSGASFGDNCKIFWLGLSNLAVSATCLAANVPNVDCILNCGTEALSVPLDNLETYLHVPIMNSKLDRFSLLRNIPIALNFAKMNLRRGKKLLLCCNTGEDISICVSLAILTSLFTNEGLFDDGKFFGQTCITKFEMRKRLVFICKYAINARPSRGNLKQVFNFFNGGSVDSFS